MNKYEFDWSDIAFGDKKPLKSLRPLFIAAPREISSARFTQIIKDNLPKSNIILGIAKEDYVDGFEGQPQFKTLRLKSLSQIDKVNHSKSPNKIYILNYSQRETDSIIDKLKPSRCLFINGSWKYSFHTLPTYYLLVNKGIPFTLQSPFCDEAEANKYGASVAKQINGMAKAGSLFKESHAMELVDGVAKQSFDYIFQTGVVLAKKTAGGYKVIDASYNRVVPYQTYAMHHGSLREKNFSPPNDLNHYDTIHAEMNLLISAQKKKTDLKGTTLFINLLPCPTCARTLSQTDIEEYVYKNDHSNGYAIRLLQECGKTVRRPV